MSDRPNVLFVLDDQHRGDSLGADPNCPRDEYGDPLVHTPVLDNLVQDGALFARAYSSCPSCVPARRSLWTGQTPATHGCTSGCPGVPWAFEHTLPGELSAAGYQTCVTGKTHVYPRGNTFGFEIARTLGEWREWLDRETGGEIEPMSHGLSNNTWDARPSHLPEHMERAHWITNRALDFLRGRDPTRPFFLNLSYADPHQPQDPPQAYWDMYAEQEMPAPAVGDWTDERLGDSIPTYPDPNAWCADLPRRVEQRARIGYYGMISHLDGQIHRVLDYLRRSGALENTFVIFTADHGEMLGDHHLWRKTYAYEGSARVPMVVRFPERMDHERGRIIDRPVGIEDVMPTLLEVAGVEVPESVEGRSLVALFADEGADWRECYHGEHDPGYDEFVANQYLVSETMKYIWHPTQGHEQLFDLAEDPLETTDLSDEPDYRADRERFREALIDRLADHPRGLSDGDQLRTKPSAEWEPLHEQ